MGDLGDTDFIDTPAEESAGPEKKTARKRDRKRKAAPGLVELPAEGPAEGRYRVSLACPTPLAHPTLEVEARNEDEAKKKFCLANGIDDSVHTWTVERVG